MPPKELSHNEQALLALCQENPEGITDSMIQQKIKMDAKARVGAINKLLSSGKLELKTQGTVIIYMVKDKGAKALTKGMCQEEKIVYKIIEESGNQGIWTKEIRFKSNLQLTQLNKCLKLLESRKSIKSVKPVNDSKKKVYMLYDIQPASSLTGGAWYNENDFETEFVDILSRQALKFLQQQRSHAELQHQDPLAVQRNMLVGVKQLKVFIGQLGISKVELSNMEVEQIAEALVYDGHVAKVFTLGEGGKTVAFYHALKNQPTASGLTRVPCGICPVISNCKVGGTISPETCVYLKDWMKF